MLLAGDVGGTKTLLGLFRPGPGSSPVSTSGGPPPEPRRLQPTTATVERPTPVVTREYATLDFDSLDEIVQAFLEETSTKTIYAVVMGVAGPVTGHVARLTNVPWLADLSAVGARLGGCPVKLLNDLESLASAVPFLERDELAVLQEGVANPTGNAAVIAAGTGLGEGLLHNVGGRFLPSASEGGHADFAARTPRELALVDELSRIYGRVDNERVVSGHGLVNLFRFTHGTQDLRHACHVVSGDEDAADLPAAISTAAMERRCEQCVEALDMFVDAYGAEAGNLALRAMATAGVYIGGGIAPKILPELERGAFMDAFRAKDPMVDMLRTLPVLVILNQAAGLLGAAVRAAGLAAKKPRP